MARKLDGGFRFPAIDRPDQSEIDAAGNAVSTYIARVEQRAEDLSRITQLLREMDVFPDMLMKIDALVARRRAEAVEVSESVPVRSAGPKL